MDLKYIRKENQKKTLALLKKGGRSCKDLAKLVGVSNVAMYDILEDFSKKEIIRSSTTSSTLGRKPSSYALNEDYGVFAALDFTPPALKICLHNILGRELAYREIPLRRFIFASDIQKYIETMRDMLAKLECRNKTLRNICISTPGRIDPKTNYFSLVAIFDDYKNLNLQKVFQDAFGCPVLVKNNVSLALIGEINKLDLKEKDILYLYIDESVGGALLLNGHIRNGNNNFSGEIAFSRSFDGEPASKKMQPVFVAENYRKLVLADPFLSREEKTVRFGQTIDDLIDLYKQHDPYAAKIFYDVADFLSIFIMNYQSLIDCNCVLIHSYLYRCGKTFADLVENLIQKLCSIPSRKVLFTDNDEHIFIDGCINYSIDKNIISTLQLE